MPRVAIRDVHVSGEFSCRFTEGFGAVVKNLVRFVKMTVCQCGPCPVVHPFSVSHGDQKLGAVLQSQMVEDLLSGFAEWQYMGLQ